MIKVRPKPDIYLFNTLVLTGQSYLPQSLANDVHEPSGTFRTARNSSTNMGSELF